MGRERKQRVPAQCKGGLNGQSSTRNQYRHGLATRDPVGRPLREPDRPADSGTQMDAHRRHPPPSRQEVGPGVRRPARDAAVRRRLRHAANLRRARGLVSQCPGGRRVHGDLSREDVHPGRSADRRLCGRSDRLSAVRTASTSLARHQRVPRPPVHAGWMEVRRRMTMAGLALFLIALAQLMVVLDTAVVNIALPSIQRALHFTPTGLEWVVNRYALAFGGLLLLGGRAGDLFGRRRMFVAGILLFTVGSLAGGFATTSSWLVAARVAQGVGGAIVAPTALSLVADNFPEGKARNRAFGVYSAVSGAGGADGRLLGGVITNYFSWGWVLFINLPIGLLLSLAAPRVLVARTGKHGRLDLPGAATVSAGMALLVYGLNRAATYGWTSAQTVVP